MLTNFPSTITEFMGLEWTQIEPFYNELSAHVLTADNAEAWLTDWSRLAEMVDETQTRLMVEKTRNTADADIEQRYNNFLDTIYPRAEAANQRLKEKLLGSELTIPGMEIPLRNMRAEADLFRTESLPLLTEEHKMRMEYDKIVGAQTVTWEGEERTIAQMQPVLQDADRGKREQAWRLMSERQLQDRETLNEMWKRFFGLRVGLASNADLTDYRAYIWRKMLRFDYTPENCKQFADAIEQVVVPAAARIYERRRQQLGVDTLRPWDLEVDPLNRAPLHPFDTGAELDSKGAAIFNHVDPELGAYYETMRREDLLDLENRKNKAPGGYCTTYVRARRPFILMNAVGMHSDVQTLLHEAGHAFHTFETAKLPYFQQLFYTSEIAEVASMSMELLSAPYLSADQGGYYTSEDAARARIEHLESNILFWPYMAVVDMFQQWVYENPADAVDPAN
ncbi:MAG: M3 family oligoendopeptidase, partial [Burkholderiales bacterium]|nr:M3 family oligoendopeptidase [Anaerolineae bacterium]